MAKMEDVSVEEVLPYVILMEIVKSRARSVKEISEIFREFEEEKYLAIEKYEKILEVISLHEENLLSEANRISAKNMGNYSKQKNIRLLLEELGWAGTDEWLNRKSDESIKLFKEIVSIVELDNSVIEEYTGQVKEEVVSLAEMGRFVKYANYLRDGNEIRLKEYYLNCKKLGHPSKEKDYKEFMGEEEQEFTTDPSWRSIESSSIESLTSLPGSDSTIETASDLRTLGSIKSDNTLSS